MGRTELCPSWRHGENLAEHARRNDSKAHVRRRPAAETRSSRPRRRRRDRRQAGRRSKPARPRAFATPPPAPRPVRAATAGSPRQAAARAAARCEGRRLRDRPSCWAAGRSATSISPGKSRSTATWRSKSPPIAAAKAARWPPRAATHRAGVFRKGRARLQTSGCCACSSCPASGWRKSSARSACR